MNRRKRPLNSTYSTVTQKSDATSLESDCSELIIANIEARAKHRVYKDDADYSINPSYTKFPVPFYMNCRRFYLDSVERYENQFQKELNNLLIQQPNAYEAARLSRHICISTLWPPLHNRREIANTQRHFFRLSAKKRKRLNEIMTTNIT